MTRTETRRVPGLSDEATASLLVAVRALDRRFGRDVDVARVRRVIEAGRVGSAERDANPYEEDDDPLQYTPSITRRRLL